MKTLWSVYRTGGGGQLSCIIDLSSQGPDDGPLMDRNMSSCQ